MSSKRMKNWRSRSLRNEGRINQLEIEIDDMAIGLLALQAPLAADLRLVTAAIKINNDLERMGDLSVSIAQSALALIREPLIRPLIDIPHIAGLAQSMVRKSLDAFVNRDGEMARSVLASDDAVDNMRTASYHELMSFMEKNPQQIPQALYLLSVVRNLERIARSRYQYRRGRLVSGERNRRASSQRRTSDVGSIAWQPSDAWSTL